MSDKSFINAQAIMTRLKAESSTEVIKVLGDKLCVLGYVNENYVPAVIQRESVYPTGLMLGGKRHEGFSKDSSATAPWVNRYEW
jgi:PTS system galactitol-specific IIA component